jgi:ribosome-binding protein aMBF1 (putative translation factor)
LSKRKTSDAIKILHQRYYKNNPKRLAGLEQARLDNDVARKLYELRRSAGLSQRELAELVGTTASVICRLEDSDYEGHSFAMLNRIAAALHKKVVIDFVDFGKEKKAA